MIKKGFRLWALGFRNQPRCTGPSVQLPRSVWILRATGALRVCVTGYDYVSSSFIYTTQLHWWHPLSWVLVFMAARFLGMGLLYCGYTRMVWRAPHG
jgi:hypothetical protein